MRLIRKGRFRKYTELRRTYCTGIKRTCKDQGIRGDELFKQAAAH